GWVRRINVAFGVLLFLSFLHPSWAGNTSCASGQLDWYTSVVGETPCMTYQRLRQICDNDYQVPSFRPNAPGDNCDSQVSSCCCNTVTFQLSVLCMNCQQDRLAGDQIGIDAGVGAYTLYCASCGAGTNHSLPSDIQAAVCNEGIRLDDYLYGGWDDGSWLVLLGNENAERDHAANNNNTFTHCPNQISPSPTPTVKPTNTQQKTANTGGTNATNNETDSSDTNGSHTTSNTPAIIGGTVGAGILVLLVVGGLLFWKCQGRRVEDPAHFIPDPYPDRGHGHNPFDDPMAMATHHGTYTAQHFAPHHQASADGLGATPSSSAYSSAIPATGTASNEDTMRHIDAGVTIPLFRSPSGRLPPAYHSWEHKSNAAQSQYQASPQNPGINTARLSLYRCPVQPT
ncbi:hypothetical protein GY45DRAFT_1251412, partial [Cubamyces sp. BRFM 1775]